MSRSQRAPVLSALCAVVALAGVIAAPRTVRAGACAARGISTALLTPAGRDLPVGEGLLVGHHAGRPLMAESAAGVSGAVEVTASLERGETRIAFDVEQLAPGLARIVPRTRPALGAWTLVSGEERHPIRVVATPAPAALRAPTVREVWHRQSSPAMGGIGRAGMPRGGGGASTYVGAELERTPPDGAIAVIGSVVFRGRGLPRMSAALATRSSSINLYVATGGRCAPPSIGEPVPASAVVRLQWVDAYGRLSAPSNDVIVVSR
ncbi:MAG: hypothetical protein M3Y87_05290 [Myxococcota bacterium]|nr:hypothetical protein [Myxococcota bacterium]